MKWLLMLLLAPAISMAGTIAQTPTKDGRIILTDVPCGQVPGGHAALSVAKSGRTFAGCWIPNLEKTHIMVQWILDDGSTRVYIYALSLFSSDGAEAP